MEAHTHLALRPDRFPAAEALNLDIQDAASQEVETTFVHGGFPVIEEDYVQQLEDALGAAMGEGWRFETEGGHAVLRTPVIFATAVADRTQRTIELTSTILRPCAIGRAPFIQLVIHRLALTCVQHRCSLILPHGQNATVDCCRGLIGGDHTPATRRVSIFPPHVLLGVRGALDLSGHLRPPAMAGAFEYQLQQFWYLLPEAHEDLECLVEGLLRWWTYVKDDLRSPAWFDHPATILEGFEAARGCRAMAGVHWRAHPLDEATERILGALGSRVLIVAHDGAPSSDNEGLALDNISSIQLNPHDSSGVPGPPIVEPVRRENSLNPAYRVLSRSQRNALPADARAIILPASASHWNRHITREAHNSRIHAPRGRPPASFGARSSHPLPPSFLHMPHSSLGQAGNDALEENEALFFHDHRRHHPYGGRP